MTYEKLGRLILKQRSPNYLIDEKDMEG